MSLYEWAYLTCIIGAVVMILNDSLNALTAAVREVAQAMRERKP